MIFKKKIVTYILTVIRYPVGLPPRGGKRITGLFGPGLGLGPRGILKCQADEFIRANRINKDK